MNRIGEALSDMRSELFELKKLLGAFIIKLSTTSKCNRIINIVSKYVDAHKAKAINKMLFEYANVETFYINYFDALAFRLKRAHETFAANDIKSERREVILQAAQKETNYLVDLINKVHKMLISNRMQHVVMQRQTIETNVNLLYTMWMRNVNDEVKQREIANEKIDLLFSLVVRAKDDWVDGPIAIVGDILAGERTILIKFVELLEKEIK